MSSYSDNLVKIAGGHLGTVDRLTTARRRHELIAYVMAFTACMAAVSMWFFAHDALHCNSWAAVVVALVWGVAIFRLEQVLTNLGLSAAGFGAVATTVVRLALALAIGAIISAPLTLRIFRSDVAFELAQMAAENASLIKKEIAESPEQAQVDQLEAGITHWQQVQRGVVADEGDSAEVTALESDLGAAQADLEESQHQFAQDAAWYNCERYGADRDKLDDPTKCAPGPGGVNGNTAAAESARNASQQRVAEDQRVVEDKQQALQLARRTQQRALRQQVRELQAQAPKQLADLRDQLGVASAALHSLKDRLNGTNAGNTGFLAQLDGLDRASSRSSTLNLWKWLIFAAFVILDVLPVISKLGWLFSREGRRYHDAILMTDQSALAGLQAQLDADQEIERDRIQQDRDMRIRLNQEATRQAEEVLRGQLQQELDDWKNGVQAGSGLGLSLSSSASTPVQP